MDNLRQVLKDGDTVLVILEPTFIRGESPEVEYGNIPSEVQKEVIDFFNSKTFIHDQAENYALNEVTAIPLGSKCESYPIYNTQILNIEFYTKGNTLLVYLYCRLINQHMTLNNKNKCRIYTPVT